MSSEIIDLSVVNVIADSNPSITIPQRESLYLIAKLLKSLKGFEGTTEALEKDLVQILPLPTEVTSYLFIEMWWFIGKYCKLEWRYSSIVNR